MADEKEILFTSVATKVAVKSRSYGATSKSVATTSAQRIQIHKVRPSDSLVSLAIKYETTVEELKRLNTLWSNDSLQLKSTIKVPIASVPVAATNDRNPTPAQPVSLEQFVSEDNGAKENGADTQQSASTVSGRHSGAACKSGGGGGVARSKTFSGDTRDFSEMDSNEFLRKFDMQFMQLKTNVEKMENESSLSEEDSSAYSSCVPRRSARYLSRQAFRSTEPALVGGPVDELRNPELVVRSSQLPDTEETFYNL